jgi:hypothetical protein
MCILLHRLRAFSMFIFTCIIGSTCPHSSVICPDEIYTWARTPNISLHYRTHPIPPHGSVARYRRLTLFVCFIEWLLCCVPVWSNWFQGAPSYYYFWTVQMQIGQGAVISVAECLGMLWLEDVQLIPWPAKQ